MPIYMQNRFSQTANEVSSCLPHDFICWKFLAPSVLNLEVTTGSHSAFRAPHITLRDACCQDLSVLPNFPPTHAVVKGSA